MVDLDLDVIRRRGTPVPFLVDEDEFAEHQVRYGYPAEVTTAAQSSADWLLDAVGRGTGPFGGAHHEWLATVDGV
jgi:protein associated with RNAse G/E